MNLSVLVTTIGRPSLMNTLNSLKQLGKDDQVLVCCDGTEPRVLEMVAAAGLACAYTVTFHDPPCKDWGHSLRNRYAPLARGDYLLFMDDDDCYTAGAMEVIRQTCEHNRGKLVFFAMQTVGDGLIPRGAAIECGNVGTPTGAIPNVPALWGTWGSRYEGDFDFYNGCRFEVVWQHQHVICVLRPHTYACPESVAPFVTFSELTNRPG